MAEYSEAPQVQEIARELIAKHHPHLDDPEVLIQYCFVDKAPSSGGKATLGVAKKVGDLEAFFADHEGPFFRIVIAGDAWGYLKPAQQVALVDHELMHCSVGEDKDGNKKAVLRPHDLEEFKAIVARHGVDGLPDIRGFVEAANRAGQMTLEDILPSGNGASGVESVTIEHAGRSVELRAGAGTS